MKRLCRYLHSDAPPGSAINLLPVARSWWSLVAAGVLIDSGLSPHPSSQCIQTTTYPTKLHRMLWRCLQSTLGHSELREMRGQDSKSREDKGETWKKWSPHDPRAQSTVLSWALLTLLRLTSLIPALPWTPCLHSQPPCFAPALLLPCNPPHHHHHCQSLLPVHYVISDQTVLWMISYFLLMSLSK